MARIPCYFCLSDLPVSRCAYLTSIGLTTNQAVGSSNLSGRANFLHKVQAVTAGALAAFVFSSTSAGHLLDPCPTT